MPGYIFSIPHWKDLFLEHLHEIYCVYIAKVDLTIGRVINYVHFIYAVHHPPIWTPLPKRYSQWVSGVSPWMYSRLGQSSFLSSLKAEQQERSSDPA